MITKINSENFKKRILQAETVATTLVFAMIPAMSLYAADGADATAMVGQIIGTVGTVFLLIGAVLFAWGIGQLIMAFRDENADSKSRAMMMIVSSILMMSMPTILDSFFGSAGVDVSVGDSLL